MKAPESNVANPLISLALTRGRTTQKRVVSVRKGAVFLAMTAVTTIPERSSSTRTPSTRPTSTSRYLILVLPSSIPPALSNLMVIVGPRSLKVS